MDPQELKGVMAVVAREIIRVTDQMVAARKIMRVTDPKEQEEVAKAQAKAQEAAQQALENAQLQAYNQAQKTPHALDLQALEQMDPQTLANVIAGAKIQRLQKNQNPEWQKAVEKVRAFLARA